MENFLNEKWIGKEASERQRERDRKSEMKLFFVELLYNTSMAKLWQQFMLIFWDDKTHFLGCLSIKIIESEKERIWYRLIFPSNEI